MWEVEVEIHSFINPDISGGEQSVRRTGRFTFGETAYGRLHSRFGLSVEKMSIVLWL
jgi:hypothetical protein